MRPPGRRVWDGGPAACALSSRGLRGRASAARAGCSLVVAGWADPASQSRQDGRARAGRINSLNPANDGPAGFERRTLLGVARSGLRPTWPASRGSARAAHRRRGGACGAVSRGVRRFAVFPPSDPRIPSLGRCRMADPARQSRQDARTCSGRIDSLNPSTDRARRLRKPCFTGAARSSLLPTWPPASRGSAAGRPLSSGRRVRDGGRDVRLLPPWLRRRVARRVRAVPGSLQDGLFRRARAARTCGRAGGINSLNPANDGARRLRKPYFTRRGAVKPSGTAQRGRRIVVAAQCVVPNVVPPGPLDPPRPCALPRCARRSGPRGSAAGRRATGRRRFVVAKRAAACVGCQNS